MSCPHACARACKPNSVPILPTTGGFKIEDPEFLSKGIPRLRSGCSILQLPMAGKIGSNNLSGPRLAAKLERHSPIAWGTALHLGKDFAVSPPLKELVSVRTSYARKKRMTGVTPDARLTPRSGPRPCEGVGAATLLSRQSGKVFGLSSPALANEGCYSAR